MPVRKRAKNQFADEPKQGWAFFEESNQWRRTPEPWGAPRNHFPKAYGDWVAVSKPKNWRPPAGTLAGESLLDGGAAGLSAAEGGSGGGGMKIGAGHKPQPYGYHGWYGVVGGGSISGGYEVRGRVTPHAKNGKVYSPPPPAPKQPHRTWDQGKGMLRDEQGRVITDKGYSGQGDANNNSSQEHVEDHGPIPQGNWQIEETRDEQYQKRLARPIYRLVPDDETRARVEAMGRKPDSFLIHGDNTTHDASTGCIIVDRSTREQLRNHVGGWIHVRK